MKAWLKGGLITGLIPTIVTILLYLNRVIFPCSQPASMCGTEVLIVPGSYFGFGIPFVLDDLGFHMSSFSIILIPIIIWFIIGSIIGWIIGKIKSKKQQPVQTQPQVQSK
jgi:sorbitol-specific phosphotransferase system component IIC